MGLVFNYFRRRPAAPELSLKELTLNPDISSEPPEWKEMSDNQILNTDNMELTTDKCIFQITDKVKQSHVGTHIPPLSFVAYPKDKKLRIIFHLQENLKRTTPFRKDSKQLLLSHVKPHGPVRKDTISRWCKSVLSSAGIDTSKFKGHSTRPHRPPILQIIT